MIETERRMSARAHAVRHRFAAVYGSSPSDDIPDRQAVALLAKTYCHRASASSRV